jgi:phosphoenolpyruvate-protein kinase (PTS system EI component)
MIETPAAARRVHVLIQGAQWIGLGTNDLFAAHHGLGRDVDRAMDSASVWDPPLWRLVRRVTTQAHAAGISVNACGEVANQLPGALALVALGSDALTVTPEAIARIRPAATLPKDSTRAKLAEELLGAATAAEIQALLQRWCESTSAQTISEGEG